ncbi:flavin mononucleotide reductase [Acetobacter nitrogenifigens DSM 23921 = NBRC 105050]|uniref:Flavin reductase n=1 Tax=Acetobacter nitrogenifigens DSM 23921 = NBRC 105050 TaxID=1120919 RepID=A0A511XC78_9PROT|nr:flavin reductase [Acetobacter nitrogenifigens]GBQ94196.1 flavin mononucleotide reductase [Acetobacter nitrogenifigens DSM 23921 = NBRC 105050]GEN60540.1 flavin reductase [Acetobacter nitrogenifigens DSM 23921 = NBRC 105050]
MLRDADTPTATISPGDVTQDDFRRAMSLLGAPVVLVTTDGAHGRHGLTVSAICSVSDTPPTVLICLNRSNRSHAAFLRNGAIGISILAEGQEAIAGAFASSRLSSEERFANGMWRVGASGAPLLQQAVATLDCAVASVQTSGSHDVLFCRVNAIAHPSDDGHGLAWFDRRFHVLPRFTTQF